MQTWQFGAQQSASAWVNGAGKGGWNGSGNCFIRTKSLTDPKSWRGWNGKDWSVSFVDPYNEAPGSFLPEEHVCTPVLNLGYPSIGWSSYYRKYIAVGSKVRAARSSLLASAPHSSECASDRTVGHAGIWVAFSHPPQQ